VGREPRGAGAVVTRVNVAAPTFRDVTRQYRVGGGRVPPGAPAFRMPAGKPAQVLALPQRQVEAGQDRRLFRVEGEVVAVEQQGAGAEHGGEFGVHGAQVRLGQPVQRGRAHRGVGGAAEAESPGPAGHAQVQVDQAQAGQVRVGRQAQGQRDRVGVDADHRGLRQPAKQPDRERAGPAAEVEHERVRAAGPLLDRVDQRGEPVLSVRQALLLLAVPALDPVSRGVAVELRHAVPPRSLAQLPWTVPI
jgi:hypothetical protein